MSRDKKTNHPFLIYCFFPLFYQFVIDKEAEAYMKENEKVMKPPTDLKEMCDDLKVCGRREFSHLVRLRHKYQYLEDSKAKKVEQEERKLKKEQEQAENEMDEDAKIDAELEKTMQRIEKEKKRLAKKERTAALKSDLRKKMSVIATTTLDNDEDLQMSKGLWDKLHEKGFEGIGEESSKDGSSDSDNKSD